MTFDEATDKIGVDKEETLRRFSGNTELMERFIKKFPEDTTFNELQEALKAKNWTDIENTAHTLKGVSGNLGFHELYTLSAALVTAIREKNYTEADKLSPQTVDTAAEKS